ncbi:response regulator [Sinorhizobium garamanticum]|uniref:Response regulator n=1 Tax=Sinorhizobium garamanticum TaxID=680247 RepID=A0ABY8DMV4_9HYPH|nr:response regulator [Sinorhizobium garamanticum]WEX90895.1 response regulator [Sinorhizobium garamanticum]
MQSETQKPVAIIDDDPFILESLRDLFESMGMKSTTHTSADAFLASGDLRGVHCILTDLKMPGTNGLDLLQKVIAEGGPPVCIMTSLTDSHTEAAAQSRGAAGFLRKPISSAQLLGFVSSCRSK